MLHVSTTSTARAALAALISTLVLLSGEAPAASAAQRITFNLYMGSGCVAGGAPASSSTSVVWRSSDGTLKASATQKSDIYGSWQTCSRNGARVEVGDHVSVS